MSGGVSVGAGGSSGGWSPLQAGAGQDPARGSASPGYVERGSSGADAWFAGLLVLVAVPGVNLVLGPVAMMVAGLRGGSRRAEPGRSNGRRAASWGLTFLLGEALLIGTQLYIGKVVGLLGVFRTVLVLCFRLPSSGPGTRFRPRRECDTLGLSEDEYDCISARSTRQYRSSPCPSLGIPSGTLSHS